MAGYSESTARDGSIDILKRPHIQRTIERLKEQSLERSALDGAEVVNQIGAIALAEPTDYLKLIEDEELGGDRWTGKSPDELTARQKAAVKTIQVRDVFVGTGANRRWVRQEYKYTLHDKSFALQLLGKHFDIFGDRLPPGASDTGRRLRELPQEELEQLDQHIRGMIEKRQEPIDGEVLSDA